ncbi:MAG: hypothetical protein PVI40_02715 [Chlamydiota bacterium]|jgi:hypothetical protein
MRYTITNQHINFFLEHGFIDFEDVFTEKEKKELYIEASGLREDISSSDLYKKGRDLWRTNAIFKNFAFKKSLAKIASELTGINSLRLAFDQLYFADQLFSENDSLGSYFSFKRLACMVLIQANETDFSKNTLFSNSPLGCTFIQPYKALPLEDLQKPDSVTYMLGFCPVKTLYVKNELDPNTHFLKQFGYTFGDFLLDEYHPIIS